MHYRHTGVIESVTKIIQSKNFRHYSSPSPVLSILFFIQSSFNVQDKNELNIINSLKKNSFTRHHA